MLESKGELRSLQELLDLSREKAGKHLRDIFHPITARELCRKFTGVRQVAWATVNSKSEPRVAPVDAVLIHGRFYLSTDQSAIRTKDVRRNPATSLAYFEDISFAVVVHGRARVLDKQLTHEF